MLQNNHTHTSDCYNIFLPVYAGDVSSPELINPMCQNLFSNFLCYFYQQFMRRIKTKNVYIFSGLIFYNSLLLLLLLSSLILNVNLYGGNLFNVCLLEILAFSSVGWGKIRQQSDEHKSPYQHFSPLFYPSLPPSPNLSAVLAQQLQRLPLN